VIAGLGHQCLACPGQLALQISEQLAPRFGVPARFFLVTADEVAPAGESHLLDRQLGLALLAGDDERQGDPVILQEELPWPGFWIEAVILRHISSADQTISGIPRLSRRRNRPAAEVAFEWP